MGAIAIVLAAMYMLRLISPCSMKTSAAAPSPRAALDLRPAEIGIVTPLVVVLLFLSFWPAAITDYVFFLR